MDDHFDTVGERRRNEEDAGYEEHDLDVLERQGFVLGGGPFGHRVEGTAVRTASLLLLSHERQTAFDDPARSCNETFIKEHIGSVEVRGRIHIFRIHI